ncbi:MAG: Lrp/AsnC family transcriptional regulator [bacterium]|nr:Lrp/AsnC family transcriptional regulator [bacterium]
MFDDRDRKILSILQSNARTSNAEIARRIGMAASAVLERIRKLEARGAIQGYEARVNPQNLGLGLTAFAFVTALEPLSEMKSGEALCQIPEIQEVHYIAGEDCYLVKIRVADPEALGRLIREKIGAIPGMHRTRSTMVLTTLKDGMSLPL